MGSTDHPQWYPFISPNTGDLDEVMMTIVSEAAATNIDVAVYSDSEGFPDAQQGGYFAIDASVSGDITQTSVTGDAISVTRGTQYWFAICKDTTTACTIRIHVQSTSGGIGLISSFASNASAKGLEDDTLTALPATVTPANVELTTVKPVIRVKFA
jgi:hypothetical protein